MLIVLKTTIIMSYVYMGLYNVHNLYLPRNLYKLKQKGQERYSESSKVMQQSETCIFFFLKASSAEQRFSILMKYNLLSFSLIAYVFWYPKKSLLNLMSSRFSFTFSSRSFIVLAFLV